MDGSRVEWEVVILKLGLFFDFFYFSVFFVSNNSNSNIEAKECGYKPLSL